MENYAAGKGNVFFRKITRMDSNEICLDADMIRLLIAIDEKKEMTQIAREVGMNAATLNATISKLLELNLIEPVQKDIEYLGDEFLDSLRMNLSRIIGPMAEILIEDAAKDMNMSLREIPKPQAAELISTISLEIPDEQSRIQFKKLMLKELNRLQE
jgi:predicted transcriptional regulator